MKKYQNKVAFFKAQRAVVLAHEASNGLKKARDFMELELKKPRDFHVSVEESGVVALVGTIGRSAKKKQDLLVA